MLEQHLFAYYTIIDTYIFLPSYNLTYSILQLFHALNDK